MASYGVNSSVETMTSDERRQQIEAQPRQPRDENAANYEAEVPFAVRSMIAAITQEGSSRAYTHEQLMDTLREAMKILEAGKVEGR